MQSSTLVQVRVDRPLKEEVSTLFESLGIDISTAVRMFFQRCRAEQGIPFPLTNAVTPAHSGAGPRIGLAKGKWAFPKDWEKRDKAMDKEIEKDFRASLA